MKLSRRGMLTGAAAVGATGVIGLATRGEAATTQATTQATTPATTEVTREPVELTWFGTHAWQIRSGEHIVLTDPWLTRFKTGTFTPEGANPRTQLVINRAVIDRYLTTADAILVHHGHYDHMTDVPYVARKTQATVLGTQSHVNMLRALQAPKDLLSPVRGGEYLPFEGFTVEVFPSLHSCGGKRHTYAYPGYRLDRVPPRPRVIEDLVEGGTLAYVISIGGLRILSLSTANFDPNALKDLRVDVVLAAPGGEPGITDRLLTTIKPVQKVIATHWDDFDQPLDEPAVPWTDLTKLRTSVETAGAEFVVLDHLEKVSL
ncbi:L-ascorbate metabolism protein UlaG (beta-lactamase superfamily) [Kribbella antiqua]|uniref:L-ascorbate metabolism protein UlaG (Beta-lactamase superfamily) n=1 Tax=Kribbella antiqua TaxID=2512217 RepID=A0A4R2IG18_9ACTN|nr:MBL fold metallo-hydrolase [Kribbella antiqua]TCO43664.1 L-ascorbate metabolism protein UlaG (beta-lactamase superfamily) [Kribbella antiqua]